MLMLAALLVLPMSAIYLIPIDSVDAKALAYLEKHLPEVFNKPVHIGQTMTIPAEAYNKHRQQYCSTDILPAMEKYSPKQADALLGVTEADLYAGNLNFVFGEADPTRRCAVISLARLRIGYGKVVAEENLYLERTLKEAVHELGHVYGLSHCSDWRCVMFFSNSLMDTDRKGYRFCARCRSKLEKKGGEEK